jgi:hypothetical protein
MEVGLLLVLVDSSQHRLGYTASGVVHAKSSVLASWKVVRAEHILSHKTRRQTLYVEFETIFGIMK